jgi:predicted dehydrogenase
MIKWGIIGCGDVTEVKSGPAFNKVKDSQLIAVMRRNAALAEDYAKRHKVPKFYSSANDLINDKEINAIYIATPPGNHAEYALMSIKAGKPVYIEKPMATNYDECRRINEAGEKNNIPVFVAYYRRALPGFVKVKEIINNGLIGKVSFAQIQLFRSATQDEKAGRLSWRVDPALSGGGHFFDMASHQLDYLDFVFGPVQNTKSTVMNQAGLYSVEDFVAAELEFSDNVTVFGTWCFTCPPGSERDSIEIFGDKGAIKFSTFSFEPIVLTTHSGRQEFVNERPEHVQYNLIEQVVGTLSGNGNAVSTGQSGARTSKVMEDIVSGYYKDKSKKTKVR